ncbi:MAG: type VI immunity family protein [Candidatus Thiodiazotropha sp.]
MTDPNQVIADLIQTDGGLCVFDKIYLPFPHKEHVPAAKFGLGVELFLPDIDRLKLRDQVKRFMVDYCQTFPGKVNQILPDNKEHLVSFSGNPTPYILEDFEEIPIEEGYGSLLQGKVNIGQKKDSIAPYKVQTLVKRPRERELSFVNATFPVCSDADQPNFDNLLSSVLRWCAICQPAHGCAGFTFIFLSEQNSVYAMQMIKRFPGFDFQNGGRFSLEAETIHNRIKSVNWLTLLNDALVEELGGLDDMRSTLEPVCKVHEYPGGVVIQAGAYPHVGDTYRNDVPEAYRLVANYTKPIRFESYRSGLFRVPHNLDKGEETQAWLRRFD